MFFTKKYRDMLLHACRDIETLGQKLRRQDADSKREQLYDMKFNELHSEIRELEDKLKGTDRWVEKVEKNVFQLDTKFKLAAPKNEEEKLKNGQ